MCHQLLGKNIVSPGFCIKSLWGKCLYFGYSFINHSAPLIPASKSSSDLNVSGGNRIHRFFPCIMVFQAQVATGSMWRDVPALRVLINNHLKLGLSSSSRQLNRSSLNHSGISYSSKSSLIFLPLSANVLSKINNGSSSCLCLGSLT